MNSSPSSSERARIALALLSAARPAPPPATPGDLPSGPDLAKEIAAQSADLSLALAATIRSGNAAAAATRIEASLAAQHDVIRRIHRLPARPGKS